MRIEEENGKQNNSKSFIFQQNVFQSNTHAPSLFPIVYQ